MSPVVNPGVWQDDGGMYKCRAMGLAYKLVVSLPFARVMFKSIKVTVCESGLNSHVRPISLTMVWNDSQCWVSVS